jgi:hypothetical protein
LEVVLLKRTYVFPWSQFLYAEGGNDEIRLTFSTHDVLVKGSNLDSLMASIAGCPYERRRSRVENYLQSRSRIL